MKKLTLKVPGMYADHHVSAVREALRSLPGIDDIEASALFKNVTISYEPDKTDPASIGKCLQEAGYPASTQE